MHKTIGSRELKTRLGAYLRQIREGLTIIVTDRGRPIAELRPLSQGASAEMEKLDDLVTRGVVSRKSTAPLASFKPIHHRGPSFSAAVINDRKDRF